MTTKWSERSVLAVSGQQTASENCYQFQEEYPDFVTLCCGRVAKVQKFSDSSFPDRKSFLVEIFPGRKSFLIENLS